MQQHIETKRLFFHGEDSDRSEIEQMVEEGLLEGPVDDFYITRNYFLRIKRAAKECDKEALRFADEKGYDIVYCTYQAHDFNSSMCRWYEFYNFV